MTSVSKSGESRIPGTKPSLHSGQTLVSSGIPSLDYVIDGGIPLGSLVVIEEDLYGDYARLLLSYFMSEAVCSQHPLLVTSLDADPGALTQELPAPVDISPASSAPPQRQTDDNMSIAWRYQSLPQAPAPVAGRFGQHYDLSRYIPQSELDAARVFAWTPQEEAADGGAALTSLLQRCEKTLTQATEPASVRRLAVHSLGSPLWNCLPSQVVFSCQLLRAMLRRTSSVAMVTVPTHLWSEDPAAVWRLRRAADICIGLESFQGAAARNPAFSEYHGLLHLHRLSAQNLLAARYPRSADLAFKVRRKKFSVETLHLPPELGETPSRTQQHGERGGCGSARPGGVLDF